MEEFCKVCSENNFKIEDGKKICIECGHVEERYLEFSSLEHNVWANINSQAVRLSQPTDKPDVGSSERDDHVKDYSSWEMYNIILKKWTDILLSCGASPGFRDVVMNLWFLYLQKMKIAFVVDDTSNCVMKGSLPVGKRDEYVLHRKKPVASCTDYSRGFKRKAEEKEKVPYSKKFRKKKECGSDGDVLSKAEMPKVVESDKHHKNDEQWLEEGQSCFSDIQVKDDDSSSHVDPNQRAAIFNYKLCTEGKMNYYRSSTPFHMDIMKLFCLFYLAVLLSKERFLLMDLLRWCREGHIPYFSAQYLLPKGITWMAFDADSFAGSHMIPSSYDVRQLSTKFALFLFIESIPLPTIKYVTKRFLSAFSLPKSMKSLVIKTAKIRLFSHLCSRAKMQFSHPPVEAIVAAAIIAVMKYQFFLDDIREEILSGLAEQINSKLENSSLRVFSWTEWKRYICHLHDWCKLTNLALCTGRLHMEDLAKMDSKRFLQYFWTTAIWRQRKHCTKYRDMSDLKFAKKFMECQGKSLEDLFLQERLFGPTKDPLRGYVEQYLVVHEKDKASDAEDMLKKAKELSGISFEAHLFDWTDQLETVEASLSEGTCKYKVHRCTFEDHRLGFFHKHLYIPRAAGYYWVTPSAREKGILEDEEKLVSFKWLIEMFAFVFEISQQELLAQVRHIEGCLSFKKHRPERATTKEVPEEVLENEGDKEEKRKCLENEYKRVPKKCLKSDRG